MATQTGSYDFKAAKEAHDAAAQTADKYITEVSDGIFVAPEGQGPSDTQTPTGWSIKSALELIKGGYSYIKAWFNDLTPTVRIGKDAAANITMTDTGLDFMYDDKSLFSIEAVPNTDGLYTVDTVLESDTFSGGESSDSWEVTIHNDSVSMPSGIKSSNPNAVMLYLDGSVYRQVPEYATPQEGEESGNPVFTTEGVIATYHPKSSSPVAPVLDDFYSYGYSFNVRGDFATTVVLALASPVYESTKMRLGNDGESNLELDYHSLQLIDKDGDTYFHVSDLRGADGRATVTIETKVELPVVSIFPPPGVVYHEGSNPVYMGVPFHSSNFGTGHATFVSGNVGNQAITDAYPFNGGGLTTIILEVASVASVSTGDSVTLVFTCDLDILQAFTFGARKSGEFIGPMSAAFGSNLISSGSYSFAHGLGSSAKNNCSHAQNLGTIAIGPNQTALGRYNKEDFEEYAAIIGNGTADNARSNALAVCWDGAVEIFKSALERGVVVSSNQWKDALRICDKNGEQIGYLRAYFMTDGREGMQFETRRLFNGAYKYAGLRAGIDASGNESITLTPQQAWRDALGFAWGHHWWSGATGNQTAARTWYSHQYFSGYTQSGASYPSGYFQNDTNGLKCLKKGTVAFFASGHQNHTANNVQFAYRLWNHTQNKNVRNHDNYYYAPVGWLHWDLKAITGVNANDIIIIQAQKYSNETSTGWRMSSGDLFAVYLSFD